LWFWSADGPRPQTVPVIKSADNPRPQKNLRITVRTPLLYSRRANPTNRLLGWRRGRVDISQAGVTGRSSMITAGCAVYRVFFDMITGRTTDRRTDVGNRCTSGACSTAHRSNRPDLSNIRPNVRQVSCWLSFSSSRTKWQRLPAGDTLRSVSPAGNRCHFVLFYWMRMKVVQQLTCLTFGRPNDPAYSTGLATCSSGNWNRNYLYTLSVTNIIIQRRCGILVTLAPSVNVWTLLTDATSNLHWFTSVKLFVSYSIISASAAVAKLWQPAWTIFV